MKKLLYPLIKKYWAPLLSTLIVSALGCGLMVGLSSSYISLDRSLNGYIVEYGYPSAMITTGVTDRSKIAALEAVPGVAAVTARLCGDTIMIAESGRCLSVRLFTFSEDDILRFSFRSRIDSGNRDEVYVEYTFADYNDIHVGDTVRFKLGDEYRSLLVSAIVSSPESISIQAANNVWGDNPDFGYAYLPTSLLAKESEKQREETEDELEANADELDSAEKDAESEFSSARDEIEAAREQLREQQEAYQSALEGGRDQEAQLRAARADLLRTRAELERSISQLDTTSETLTAAREQLPAQIEALRKAQSSLGDIDSSLDRLRNVYSQLLSGDIDSSDLSSLSSYLQRVDRDGSLAGRIQRAANLVTQIRDLIGRQEDADASPLMNTLYLEAANEVSQAIDRLTEQRDNALSSLQESGISPDTIDSSLSALTERAQEIDQNLAGIPAAKERLRSSIREIDRNVEEIDAALRRIEAEKSSAEARLSQAEQEIAQHEKELEQSWADALTEFSSLRGELADAFRQLSESDGYETMCNQFLLYLEPDMDHEQVLEAAKAALGDVVVRDSYTYVNSPIYKSADLNLSQLQILSTFLPTIFFLIISIVVFLFMSLVIRQCRREVGILRALGYSTGGIRLLFCIINLVVSVGASLLGFLIGYVILRFVGSVYTDFFSLPRFYYRVNSTIFLLSIVVITLVGQIATYLSAGVIARVHPSEAMSRPAPATVSVPRLLRGLLRGASPMTKFSILSMYRNKKRFLLSSLCIASSTMLIFSAFAFITSKNFVLRQTFDERILYDCQVFFEEPPTDQFLDELNALDYVRSAQSLPYCDATVSFGGGGSKRAVVNALDTGSELIGIYDAEGERLSVPADGIVLEKHLAQYLGAGVGDLVSVNGVPLTVQSITDQCVDRINYVSPKTAARLGEMTLGSVILRIDEADEQALLSYLLDHGGYLYAIFTHLTLLSFGKIFETYELVSWVLIGFAILIGLVIVLNTSQTNLLEKKKELCILRTLGFTRGELSIHWFIQSLLQFLISCILGFPAGRLIAKYVLFQLCTENREYIYANSLREYLLTAALVLAFITLSHLLAMRSLRKWDIVETVKEKE